MLTFASVNKRNLHAGDDIIVAGPDGALWYAKLSHDVLKREKVKVWWFYDRSECKLLNDRNELLLSDHRSTIHMDSLQSFADVGDAPGSGKYWRKLVQVRRKNDGTLAFTVKDTE